MANNGAVAAPTPDDVAVRITAAQNGQTVNVAVGQRFAIELVGVPTAGYVWTPTQAPAFLTPLLSGGFEIVLDLLLNTLHLFHLSLELRMKFFKELIGDRLRPRDRVHVDRFVLTAKVGLSEFDAPEPGFFGRLEQDVGDLARGDADGPSVAVPLAEYRPNDLRAVFEASGPGVFVVKDSYFPGWQATVDDVPVEILPADYIYRAVPVRAGSHRVEMRFRPTYLPLGAGISLLTLAGVLGYFVVRRQRTRAPQALSAAALASLGET